MTVCILHGDMREKLAEIPAESVDAIVTDPPYHLTTGKKGDSGGASLNENSPAGRARVGTGFMGMKWDGGDIAMRPETWEVLLRVAKPGAHLLAFGGTRTFHRLWCAVEDAGWEIRDTLMYLHGEGFPKSMNLDRRRGHEFCGCSESDDQLCGVRHGTDDAACVVQEGQGSNVQPTLFGEDALSRNVAPSRSERWTSELVETGSRSVQEENDRRIQPLMEGRSDVSPSARRLSNREVRQGTGMGDADGAQGWLCDGAQAGDGRVDRPLPDAPRNGASRRPQSAEQSEDESGTVARQPFAQAGRAWPTCGRCGKPIIPRGLGTALKPAFEPILLARKPIVGTVAENVLRYGTGALNIDACRIPGAKGSGVWGSSNAAINRERMFNDSPNIGEYRSEAHDLGRWPANVLHDGSDEVVAMFPPEAGAAAPVRGTEPSVPGKNVYGRFARGGGAFHADGGSAARFFWCPKASRCDRNEGLEGAPRKAVNWSSGEQSPGTFQSPNTDRLHENFHPTVKPTELMQYLVRLVTPKGGMVLDPFMGSGSTGKAAVREGMSFVGIELDERYIEIARRRIHSVAPLFTKALA